MNLIFAFIIGIFTGILGYYFLYVRSKLKYIRDHIKYKPGTGTSITVEYVSTLVTLEHTLRSRNISWKFYRILTSNYTPGREGINEYGTRKTTVEYWK